MIKIETSVKPFPRDGSPAVLLQLPSGFVIIKPEDARRVAQQLIDTAAEADARQN